MLYTGATFTVTDAGKYLFEFLCDCLYEDCVVAHINNIIRNVLLLKKIVLPSSIHFLLTAA